MKTENGHQTFMRFISELSTILSGVTVDELTQYRRMALGGSPQFVPIIDGLLKALQRPRSGVAHSSSFRERNRTAHEPGFRPEHLFDLLRSKDLVPTNAELAEFAAKLLPGMTKKRFDKMSRADIAGTIIEYIEQFPPNKRNRLEAMVRDAIRSRMTSDPRDSQGFFSRWEKIIQAIEL